MRRVGAHRSSGLRSGVETRGSGNAHARKAQAVRVDRLQLARTDQQHALRAGELARRRPRSGRCTIPCLSGFITPLKVIVPCPGRSPCPAPATSVALGKVCVPLSQPIGWFFFCLPNSGPIVTSRAWYRIQSPLFSRPYRLDVVRHRHAACSERIVIVIFFGDAAGTAAGSTAAASMTPRGAPETAAAPRAPLCLTRRAAVERRARPLRRSLPGRVIRYTFSARFSPGADVQHPGRRPRSGPCRRRPGCGCRRRGSACTSPLTLIVPPGSVATPSKRSVCALVNVIVPCRCPTRVPFGLPNWRDGVEQPVALDDPVAGARALRLLVDRRDLDHDRRDLDRQRLGAARSPGDGDRAETRREEGGTPEHAVEVTPTRSSPAASTSRRARRGSRPGSRSRAATRRARPGRTAGAPSRRSSRRRR